MSYKISFSKAAEKDIILIKKNHPLTFKKLNRILSELSKHPREGIGHPEPLKGLGGVTWSRQLSKKDRIIYDIYEEHISVLVIQVGGHYDDK